MTNKQASKPRQKSISLAQVKKQEKAINKYSTYVLDPETNTVIKYYEVFSKTKIEELLTEAHKNLIYEQENNLGLFTDDGTFLKYIHFLIIKHFTHLGNDIPDGLTEQIPLISTLISTGLFETIFEECFDPEQVYLVIEKFEQFIALTEKIGNLAISTHEKINNTVENKEVFNSINFSEQKKNQQPIHPLVNPGSAE